MSASSPFISRNLFRLLSTAAIFMPTGRQRFFSTSPSVHSFTYRIAAASAAKQTPLRTPKLNQDFFNFASTQSTHDTPILQSTKKQAGEDAYFAATIGGSSYSVAFGLADGVGGWQDQGVDPSKYSHGLCQYMIQTAQEHDSDKAPRPQDILQRAYDAVTKDDSIEAGGCTASLAVADNTGRLETANLGDSGYLILGPGKITARSAPQTHAFNTPYQLAKIPKRMQAQYAIFGDTHHSETPAQADIDRHTLKHGDVVVFGTDGVWDNLSAQDTLQIVTKVMDRAQMWYKSHNFSDAETMLNVSGISTLPSKTDATNGDKFLPALIASAVMRAAKEAGLDRKRNGPFAKEVKKYYPHDPWEGGKPDDIAVVVAIAVESQDDELAKAKL